MNSINSPQSAADHLWTGGLLLMKMNQRWWKQRGDGGLADDGFRNKQSSLTLSSAVRKSKKSGTMR